MRPTKLIVNAVVLATVMVGGMWLGCNSNDSTSGPSGGPTTKLQFVTNLRAYSASAISVGLTWTASTDAANGEFLEHQIKVKVDTTTIQTVTAATNATSATLAGLIEGTIYTFDVVLVAKPGAQTYINSDPSTVRWAPASRFSTEGGAAIDVFEIRSATGGSGIQFFNSGTAGPRVLSIGSGAGFQGVIDALVDTTRPGGVIVLESAHLNPLLVGQARVTEFSNGEGSADSLNIGQSAPPDTSTYHNNYSVTIGTQAVAAGKIVYARTSDGNYVRILIKRDPVSQTLLFNTSPNRRIRVEISYQRTPGVIYAKPGHNLGTGEEGQIR